MRWSSRACALVVAVSCAAGVVAVPAKRAAHPVAKTAAAPKVDPTMVLVGNVAMNSVHDGDDLYKACGRSKFQNLAYALQGAKVTASKTEFETEAQFQERTAKLTDAINGDGTVIICQYLSNNDDVSLTYDADRQIFRGSFNPSLAAWRSSKNTGAYVSKTRMGVRATVHSSVDIEYEADMTATFSGLRSQCVSGGYTYVNFEAPVPQADAPLLKAAGYLVIFGRIIPPYYSQSDTTGSPTLDDPYDVYTRHMTVPFRPSELALVDVTGKKIWDCAL